VELRAAAYREVGLPFGVPPNRRLNFLAGMRPVGDLEDRKVPWPPVPALYLLGLDYPGDVLTIRHRQLLVENIEVDTGHWAFLCLGQGRR
jgi:hypothetical protein